MSVQVICFKLSSLMPDNIFYNRDKKKDFVMMEQEHNQRLLKSRVQVPDKIEVDGAMRIPCHLYPECKTVFIKALGRFSIEKPSVSWSTIVVFGCTRT